MNGRKELKAQRGGNESAGYNHGIHITVRASKSKYKFLASFTRDLKRIGIRASVRRDGNGLNCLT